MATLLLDICDATSFGHFEVHPRNRTGWALKTVLKDLPSCNYVPDRSCYEVSWFDYQLLRRFLKIRGYWEETQSTAEFNDRYKRVSRWVKRLIELKDRKRTDFDIDTALQLYDHQRVGIEFLLARRHCVLADEMGVGKSAPAAAAAWHLIQQKKAKRVLIVCPASVKDQWVHDTIKRFIPEATYTLVGTDYQRKVDVQCPHGGRDIIAIIGGNRKTKRVPRTHTFDPRRSPCRGCVNGPRCKAMRGDNDSPQQIRLRQYQAETDFTIVNYELLRMDALGEKINSRRRHPSLLEDALVPSWDVVIVDEAHRLRNPRIATFEALWSISADAPYRWALSGTPIQTKLEDAWGIMRWVNPGVLGTNWWRFMQRYTERHPVFQSKILRYKNVDEVHRKLKPNIIRRKKADVLHDLPGIVYAKHYITLGADERRLYNNIVNQQVTEAQVPDEVLRDGLNEAEPIVTVTRSRQAALSAALFNPETDFSKSAKVRDLMEFLDETVNDHKCIIFCEYSSFLTKLSELLKTKKIGHVYLHGGVPAGKARRRLMNDFRNKDSCRLFLTTTAGGEGINLQVADVVVLCHLIWNPAMIQQVISRAHRAGQKNSVFVLTLLAKDTVEERVAADARFKANLSNEIVDGESLTEEPPVDMRELRTML
jgi:SNF2 family DNA or RNA helicase